MEVRRTWSKWLISRLHPHSSPSKGVKSEMATAKVFVITDRDGRLLGSVRGDPIETENGTLQFGPPPHGLEHDNRFHEVEIPEELLAGPVADLHEEFKRLLS